MSALAPTLQSFFTDRLTRQRQASPHTIAAYRDSLKLLLTFASAQEGKTVSHLDINDLNADTVSAFLDHLEHSRGNSVRTRNARLAAIRSLLHYAAPRHPESAATIERVLAIPPKRFDRALIDYLTEPEVDALIAAPDRTTLTGRRDHALLTLAIQTGLRASELTTLRRNDVHLKSGPHIACRGKGRKHRVTPLTRTTVAVLGAWLREAPGAADDPLFASNRAAALSRDALERRLALHTATATRTCPTLKAKRVTAHVLRHTAAMRLLHAGIDTAVIALWLGHEQIETTRIYLHADLTLKEHALARLTPTHTSPARYRASDSTLAFLESL
jgi:integrase/recombinase XerD